MKDKLFTGAVIVASAITAMKAIKSVRKHKLEKELYEKELYEKELYEKESRD